MLKIRLARRGVKNRPSYRMVVMEARSPRDGAALDILGHYDPLAQPETLVIDQDKALKWLRHGAQPTETAARLLAKAGIIPQTPRGPRPQGSSPQETNSQDPSPQEAS